MEDSRLVTLIGGPMDGRQVSVTASANEVEVTMEDLTRHSYLAESSESFVYVGRK